MSGLNPFTDDGRGSVTDSLLALEGGTVTQAPDHTPGDDVQHHVEVQLDMFEGAVIAEVLVDQRGDVAIPAEGDRVLVGFRVNGRPVVLGTRYGEGDDIPQYEAGERVIGHPETDSYVRLANDGTIYVESDGEVVVNDGEARPIVDVETSSDGDGHVTSIDVTRADGVFVPSE